MGARTRIRGFVEIFNVLNNSTIFTRNETFGAQFYNWDGCYDIYGTLKACNPP